MPLNWNYTGGHRQARFRFLSETQVKRDERVVQGDKVLEEKLGRNDLCPCGSSLRFKKCGLRKGCFYGVNRDYFFQGLNNTGPSPFTCSYRCAQRR